MSMKEWAEKEIEIACKRERGDGEDPEDMSDYGCACYQSALKAFNSLLEDGHSGMSIGFTKNILNRLIDGKPLTPIEDIEEVWTDCAKKYGMTYDDRKEYQCKRMSSLFKDVYTDGTVKYHDVDIYYCVDIDNSDCSYKTRLVADIIDEMFPITMPYMPESKPYKVVCDTFLFDPVSGGDYDTKGVLYVITPDGKKQDIKRYFAEGVNGFYEIDYDEYMRRKHLPNAEEE